MEYIWNVTGRCNLKCEYCWDIFKKEKELDTLSAKKVIDKISEDVCEMLLFTGGEPLVRKDIFQLIYYAKQKGVKNIKICTNGSLIRNRLKDLVHAPIDEIHISLDSINGDVGYRTISNQEIMKNIELLTQNMIYPSKIVIVSVLDFNHIEEFESLIIYAKKNHIQVSYQLPAIDSKIEHCLNMNKLSNEKKVSLFKKLEEYHKKYKDTIDYFANFYYMTAKEYYLQNKIPLHCGAGEEFQIISPNGASYDCYMYQTRKCVTTKCFCENCLIWFRSSKRAGKIIKLMSSMSKNI